MGRMKDAVKELMSVVFSLDTYNPIKTYRELSLFYETAKPYEGGREYIFELKKIFQKALIESC